MSIFFVQKFYRYLVWLLEKPEKPLEKAFTMIGTEAVEQESSQKLRHARRVTCTLENMNMPITKDNQWIRANGKCSKTDD
jgi:hypothetical protein